MVGKIGRVSGTIEPGQTGEVMLPIGGGTSAFFAYSADGSTLAVGTQVLVVDYKPPMTVYVEKLPEFLRTP